MRCKIIINDEVNVKIEGLPVEIRRKIALKLENSGQKSFFGFDLKVGTGGIRVIELYTQTLQLNHGAKSNKVRGSGTCQTLVELFNEGWIEETVKEQLIEAYRCYRNVEHRIQMINDTKIIHPQFHFLGLQNGYGNQGKKEFTSYYSY